MKEMTIAPISDHFIQPAAMCVGSCQEGGNSYVQAHACNPLGFIQKSDVDINRASCFE
jgi:hypothetical protein